MVYNKENSGFPSGINFQRRTYNIAASGCFRSSSTRNSIVESNIHLAHRAEQIRPRDSLFNFLPESF